MTFLHLGSLQKPGRSPISGFDGFSNDVRRGVSLITYTIPLQLPTVPWNGTGLRARKTDGSSTDAECATAAAIATTVVRGCVARHETLRGAGFASSLFGRCDDGA
jgi:hypothetical protein